jgi:hypothetical protein
VHLLECFGTVVSSDTLSHDIVEEMLSEVHLGEIPFPGIIFLFEWVNGMVN